MMTSFVERVRKNDQRGGANADMSLMPKSSGFCARILEERAHAADALPTMGRALAL